MNKVKIIFAVIVLFGFICIILPSSSPNNSNKEVEQKEETKTEQQEVKENLPTKKWSKIITLIAQADKQSETFYLTGGKQKVVYSVSDSLYGMCNIYVMKEGTDLMTQGGFPIVMADSGLTDETMMRKSKGNYYLDLKIANSSCTVEIYEFK